MTDKDEGILQLFSVMTEKTDSLVLLSKREVSLNLQQLHLNLYVPIWAICKCTMKEKWYA